MKKSFIDRLYWGFWCSTTLLTGILAGYMVSHSIMLGRFFNWYVKSGNMDLLRQTYTVFRNSSNAHALYDIPLYLALVSGIIWIILSLILKRDRVIAFIAGLAAFWVGMIFSIADLDEAEEAVLTGVADDKMAQLYLSINIPLHSTFAAIFIISTLLLLFVALKNRKKAGL